MRRRSWYLTPLWTLLVVLIYPGKTPLHAQTTDPEIPASSPLWWTLTDQLSPQQLRSIYRDREDSRRRFLLAVEKGLVKPVSPEKLQTLVFFQNGSQSPELLPMYEAFYLYALRFRHRPGWPDKAPAELRDQGFSPTAVDTIVRSSYRYLAEVDTLIEKIKDGQQGFVEVMRKAEPALGKQGLRRALDRHDVAAISLAAGVPIAETRRLMADWEIDPSAKIAEDLLPQLKQELGATEWQRLRGYLLTEVAPITSAIEFEDEG